MANLSTEIGDGVNGFVAGFDDGDCCEYTCDGCKALNVGTATGASAGFRGADEYGEVVTGPTLYAGAYA